MFVAAHGGLKFPGVETPIKAGTPLEGVELLPVFESLLKASQVLPATDPRAPKAEGIEPVYVGPKRRAQKLRKRPRKAG